MVQGGGDDEDCKHNFQSQKEGSGVYDRCMQCMFVYYVTCLRNKINKINCFLIHPIDVSHRLVTVVTTLRLPWLPVTIVTMVTTNYKDSLLECPLVKKHLTKYLQTGQHWSATSIGLSQPTRSSQVILAQPTSPVVRGGDTTQGNTLQD